MKKKEDMMKHFKDGKTAFRIGKILTKLVIISFCTSNIISGQINLNNFGVTNSVKTHLGYTKFSFIDYNSDKLNDLFLYGNQEKSFVIHKRQKDSTFADAVRKFFFYPIDDFKWLTKSASGDDYYIFVSRNRRLVGLVSFTRSNSLQLLNTIRFDSYPSSIQITDFNKDGKNEALIFGNNFDGLRLIRNEGYKLNSEILLEQSLFNDLVIMDFNQDEIDDIILTDVLNNSIKFLENSEENFFATTRELNQDETILSLDKFDIDNDGFSDLILGNEKGIEILKGDSVYSFSSSTKIKNNYPIENFIIFDFNSDSHQDIGLLNNSTGSLEVLFNVESELQRIKYPLEGITDLQIMKEKDKNYLVALSEKGKLKIHSSINKFGKNFIFSAGGVPNKIAIGESNLEQPFLVFNSYWDNNVNVLSLNEKGAIQNLHKYQFLQNLSEFKFTDDLQTIIGYDLGSRLLEFAKSKSSLNELGANQQNFVYTDNPISNFFIDKDNAVKLLENNKGTLYRSTVEDQGEKYSYTNNGIIDSFVVNSIFYNDEAVLYWKKEKSELTLNMFSKEEYTNLLKFTVSDSSTFHTFIESTPNTDLIYTNIFIGEEPKSFIYTNNKIVEYSINERKDLNWENIEIKLFQEQRGKYFLCMYDQGKNELDLFEIRKDKKDINYFYTFEGVNINDYFIDVILGVSYLVYSDSVNNSINFKILK